MTESKIAGVDIGKADLHAHVRERLGLPSRLIPGKGSDVWTWLKEKATHDSTVGKSPSDGQNLWLVHGKWYDLREFADKHPGGKDWISLTKGQDITEAYEVHHLNTKKVDAVLKAYYVADAADSYAGRYNWDENSLYPVLKKRVSAHFLKQPKRADGLPNTGATLGFRILETVAMLVHFIAFYLMLKHVESCGGVFRMSVVLFGILAGFTLQPFHGIGHNALHMKDSAWMYAYDFCGWKHHKHRVSHALSHHLHPNTMLDLEHPEPTSYTFTMNAHRNSPFVVFAGPLYMWSGPLRDIWSLWSGLMAGTEPWRFEYLFNMMQLLLCMTLGTRGDGNAGPGAALGFLAFCTMHFMCGFCIETAGFGLHRSIFCWTEGDGNDKFDYGEHCLATTADHDVDMDLFSSLYLFQILNNHGIHHLFPTVCKSRISEIMPIFRDTCREFNVPWQEYAWSDMFCSLWKNWLKGMFMDTPMVTTPGRGHSVVPGSKIRIHDLPIDTKLPDSATKGSFGAIITGVDVANLSDAEYDVIRETWEERGVICIRDQKLTPHEELAFARRFPHCQTCEMEKFCGPRAQEGFDADEWRRFKLRDRPEIQLRGYGELNDYYGVTGLLDTGKGVLEYHSDSLHEYDTPPIYTSLHCKETPGKDETLFIDSRLAYELLSREERKEAEQLFVQYRREPQPLHESGLCADFSKDPSVLGKLYGNSLKRSEADLAGGSAAGTSGNPIDVRTEREVLVSEVHPLVWTHPATGRKALVSASMWMFRIVQKDGTTWTQQRSHDYLYNLLRRAEPFKYAHAWKPGDLVCFDNRSLMHSANTVNVSKQGRRLLHQIILCGDQIPQGPAGVGVGNPVVNPRVKAVR